MNAPNPSCRISSLRLVCPALAAVLLAMPEVHAATYYWDTNDSTTGFGTAGGTWAAPTTNNATQGWSTSSAGTSSLSGTTTTTTSDALNFGTASAGLATGTVAVSGSLSAGSITFGSASGNITLATANQTITLGTGGVITVDSSYATIVPKIAGSNGLTKNGTGTLVVPIPSTYSGATTVNGGTLRLENLTTNGGSDLKSTPGSNFLINNGSTLVIHSNAGGVNRIISNGDLFTFDSNGGGTLQWSQGNMLMQGGNTHRFVTNGGSQNVMTTTNGAYLNGQTSGIAEFNVADGSDAVDLLASTLFNNILITKNGTGTMSITTSSTGSYAITVNEGVLDVGGSARLNGNVDGNYSATLTTNATFSYSSSAAQTLSGLIQGTGNLTKSNTSTLTLSGSNTYSGGTTINGGAIQINHANALGTTGNITFGGGGLTYGTGITQDLSSRIKNSGSAIVIDTYSNDVTFASAVDSTNSGGITKNGTGTLTLSATNTYSGSTTINAGTLQVDGNIASSGLVINSGGTTSPGTTAAADSFGTSSISINGGGYLWTLNTANGSAGTGWDQITSTGALTSSGLLTVYAYGTPGDWDGTASYSWDIFSANSTSGFSAGNFTMNLDNFGIAAGNRTGTWAFSNPSGGIIRLSYTPLSDPVWTGGTGSFSTGFSPAPSNGDDLFFSGTVGGTATNDTLTSAGSITFMIGAGAYTLSGNAITVTGAVTNNSSSTQTLNTNVTPGSIVINDGAVEIGASGRLGGGSTSATISNSGTLIYSGTNDQTLSGVISGSGALTKNGSGTLTLSEANTYSGGTTVNSGTLILSGGTGRIVGALTVNGSGVAQYSVNSHNYFGSLSSLTLSNGGTFIDGAIGGYVQTTPSVTFNNGGTLTSAAGANGNGEYGNFLFNGPITVSGTGLATINATGVSFGYDKTITVDDTVSGSGVDLEISSKIGNERSLGYTLTKAGAGTLLLTGNNTSYANWTISSGALEIGGTGVLGAGSYAGNISMTGNFFYLSSADQSFSGVLSGAGTFYKYSSSASTLTLSGNNTMSGTFQMGVNGINETAGTVKLEHNKALGTKSISWENDGTIELATNGLTISNGMGIYNRASATDGKRRFRLDLAGTNTGTMSGAFDIRMDGTTFDVGTDDTLTLTGNIYNGAGAGGFIKTGDGTLVLTGSTISYDGTTTISAGTLQIGAGGTTGSLTTNNNAVTNNGTLVFNRSNDLTVSNVINGTGALTKNGSGDLILTANNGYSGDTNINQGVLELQASSAFHNVETDFYINNGSTLRFRKTTGNGYFLDSGDIITFDSNGGGLLDIVSGINFVVRGATITTSGGAENTIQGSFNMDTGGPVIFDVAAGSGAVVSSLLSSRIYSLEIFWTPGFLSTRMARRFRCRP